MAYNYINDTGVIQPDTSELLEDVKNEYRNALGDDISTTPDTPQGVMITAETLARDNVVRNNVQLANQLNPNLAGGVFLDAISELTGLQREAATRSLVTATLYGVQNTVIPSGVRVRNTDGDLFELLESRVIGSGGSVSGVFRAVEFGVISAPADSLTNIVDGVLGWESVNNTAGAALGKDEQSDYSLRVKRRNTLANQGVALAEAITSGLYATEGVRSLRFYENYTGAEVTVGGVAIAAHSVYACVEGGSDADVAATLLRKKSMGCAWTGTVEVNVPEPFSEQLYVVKFDRPIAIPIKVRSTVRSDSVLIDPQAEAKQALLDYVAGLQEGEQGFAVGRDVSSFELAGAINRAQARIYVQSLEMSDDDGATWSTDEITVAINKIATLDEDDIATTVAV